MNFSYSLFLMNLSRYINTISSIILLFGRRVVLVFLFFILQYDGNTLDSPDMLNVHASYEVGLFMIDVVVSGV